MTDRVLTLDDVAPEFAQAVARLRDEGGSATLVLGGRPVARLVPVDSADPPKSMTGAEFAALWRDLPHLSPEEADAFARDIEEGHKILLPPRDPWA